MPLTGKNKTSSVVFWFYQQFLNVKPDASIYARYQNKKNPKSLVYLLEPDADGMNAIYTVSDIAELIYYLEDCGVTITTLNVVTIPGLMFNYMHRKQSETAANELARTVDYLKGSTVDAVEKQFSAPSGW